MTEKTDITESTQPDTIITTTKRGRKILFGALALFVLFVIAILTGYSSGIGVRKSNQSTVIMQQLGEQYQNALIDIQFARYLNTPIFQDMFSRYKPT